MIIRSMGQRKNLKTVIIIRIIQYRGPPPHQKRLKYKTVTIIQGHDYLHNQGIGKKVQKNFLMGLKIW